MEIKKKILLQLLSFSAIAVGMLALLGWVLNIPALKSVSSGLPPMRFNATFVLIFLGYSLHLLVTGKRKLLLRSLCAAVGTFGIACIYQDLAGVQLGIDEFFIKDQDALLFGYTPGRPPLEASSCFVLLASALFLLSTNKNRMLVTAQYLLHCVTLISFIVILWYLLSITFFEFVFFTSMPLNTLAMLFLLSLGATWLHDDKGIAALFSGTKTGNIMAKRLFPQMLVMLLIIAFLRGLAYQRNWVSQELGIALIVTSFLVLSLLLIWYNANKLNLLDDKRKMTEDEVANLNQDLKKYIKNIEDYKYALDASSIVAITDQKGTIQYTNENFIKVAKYSKEELIGQNHRLLNSGYHDKEFFRNLWTTIASGKIWKGEIRNKAKDGTIYWLDTTIVPFLDYNRKPYQYLAIRSDITERKKIEEQLKTNEQRTRFLVDHAPAGIAMYDQQMRYLMVSKRWLQDYKLGDRNVIGLSHYDLFPELPERWKEFHRRCLAGETLSSDGEPFPRADGTVDWVKWDLFPWHTETGSIGGVIIFAELITERKKAEQELKASEENYRRIFENSLVAILILNAENFKVITANEVAANLYGYKSKQDLIDNFDSKYHYINPTEREENRKIILKTGKFSDKILKIKKLDGTPFWVKTFSTFSRETNTIQTALADITLQVKMEEELAAKVTELQNVNKELESFNFISSHDLQEPLRKIQNFASLLKEEKGLSSDGKYYLQELTGTSKKMRTLIEDLLQYSRIKNTVLNFEKTNINTIIKEIIEDSKESINEKKADINIQGECEATVIPFQFRLLLSNLLSNSLKFSQPEIRPDITIKIESLYKNGSHPKLSDNIKYCHIRLTDNGIGFDPKYNERIFNFFERLNGEKYPGTGLGLAICKRIVENHHGLITANGELNKGAQFDIYIPSDREK